MFPATDALIGDGLDWNEIEALAGPLAKSPKLLGSRDHLLQPGKGSDGACGRRLGKFLEGIVEGNP